VSTMRIAEEIVSILNVSARSRVGAIP
jgi:hypothetical protein